jgi:3,4-dihydroxyphenylacetate 2,3-dioxygenase
MLVVLSPEGGAPMSAGRFVLGLCVPHTPRIVHPETAGAVFQPMIAAMRRAAATVREHRADAMVLISAHWATTFDPYVDAAERHRGVLTAMECPDLISSIAYDFPGDPMLARTIVAEAVAAGIPARAIDEPHHVLDYGTIVPIRYLTPDERLPVVPVSSCPVSTLAEYLAFGAAIRRAVESSGKRVVLVASSAFAHNLVRGPETWPTREEKEIDDHLIRMLEHGELAEARGVLPAFAARARYEQGGKPVAAFLGALPEGWRGRFYGYGPSSGSGNPILAFESEPALAA